MTTDDFDRETPFLIIVKKSAITSFDTVIPYPSNLIYQLAFLTPGKSPFDASSRSTIRETPKKPMYPRARPV